MTLEGESYATDPSRRPHRNRGRILPQSRRTGENKGQSQQKATGGPTILLSIIKHIFSFHSSAFIFYPSSCSALHPPRGSCMLMRQRETTGLKPSCHPLGQFLGPPTSSHGSNDQEGSVWSPWEPTLICHHLQWRRFITTSMDCLRAESPLP